MDFPHQVDLELCAALEQWTDKRVISDDDLYDLLAFCLYQKSILVNSGFTPTGFSCSQRNGQTLLALKAKQGDTQLVVFVTANDTMGCVRKFWDLWIHDKLTWVKDKYA
jgi:hypothetical protein